MDETFDGGFVVAGLGGAGGRVLKLNPVGKPMWETDYLPAGYAAGSVEADSIQQTADGGYIVAGQALSQGYATSYDAWLLRLDREGNVEWSRAYGGAGWDDFATVQQTGDGGYIVAGNTASIGSGHSSNGWIAKLNAEGSVVWQKVFVGEDVNWVGQTIDGDFVATGTVGVDNKAETWVFKLDPEGSIVWQKAYDVAARTEGHSVHQTHDGGYVVAGASSLGGLLLRLDETGAVLWARTLSGFGVTTYSVRETLDGGFIVAGRSLAPLTGPWLIRLDANGDMLWGKLYGDGVDFLFDAHEVDRGGNGARGRQPGEGFVVVGTHLCCGFWVLRLDDNGRLEGCPPGLLSGGWVKNDAVNVEDTTQFGIDAGLAGHSTVVVAKTLEATAQEQCPLSPNN